LSQLFSLCLSRACLGKMIVLGREWLEKGEEATLSHQGCVLSRADPEGTKTKTCRVFCLGLSFLIMCAILYM
jgi:hypothetical protein